MRQAYRILPVYTGDVSGVCSALYELGGMIVMHDPSGCNSTYNTHDEIRWYDRDSLIFLSGLSEPDAVMGNDEKLIGDVIKAAETYRPKFIALCNSPIPYLNGTDFAGISEIIRTRTGIRTFYIPTNGMHDYVRGAGLAFEEIARILAEEKTKMSAQAPAKLSADYPANSDEKLPADDVQDHTVNILGFTPLDFAAENEADSLAKILNEAGWKVQSCWSMGRYVEGIGAAGRAQINLVVSSTGLRAAKVLRDSFGTPWVAGVPVRGFRETLYAAMEQAAAENKCIIAYDMNRKNKCDSEEETHGPENQELNAKQTSVSCSDPGKPAAYHSYGRTAVIIGEPVFCCSLAAGMQEGAVVICTTEDGQELLRSARSGSRIKEDLVCRGEEEVENSLVKLRPDRIIADPMYRLILPGNFSGEFTDMPHLAFSGRIYLKDMKSRFI